jgi:2,4-dienoyl-CoA reductase-like NADH-dependent reductase (Old Yellow Enzyme family)
MSTVTDLMEDALDVTMEYIEGPRPEEGLNHKAIALEALVFVNRAAKKKRREYTESEIQDIIEGFLTAMKFYSTVTGMQGITSLDLTRS